MSICTSSLSSSFFLCIIEVVDLIIGREELIAMFAVTTDCSEFAAREEDENKA